MLRLLLTAVGEARQQRNRACLQANLYQAPNRLMRKAHVVSFQFKAKELQPPQIRYSTLASSPMLLMQPV
jgi:hypothetical protein